LDVDGGRVALVDAVAGELALIGRFALAQRVVLRGALLRAGGLAQVALRVAAVAVAVRLYVVAADVAGRVVWAHWAWVAVLVEAIGVHAVAQPAELEHHPRLVDERVEQVVGDLALGLLGVVERAAVGAGQERHDSVLVQRLASPTVRSGW